MDPQAHERPAPPAPPRLWTKADSFAGAPDFLLAPHMRSSSVSTTRLLSWTSRIRLVRSRLTAGSSGRCTSRPDRSGRPTPPSASGLLLPEAASIGPASGTRWSLGAKQPSATAAPHLRSRPAADVTGVVAGRVLREAAGSSCPLAEAPVRLPLQAIMTAIHGLSAATAPACATTAFARQAIARRRPSGACDCFSREAITAGDRLATPAWRMSWPLAS